MTRGSILEYVEAMRGRYLGATKKGKGRMLDEFTQVVGCHRKAAIRRLRRGNQPQPSQRRGRPRRYGAEVAQALKAAWEATDRLCSRRLQPFLPELVRVLRGCGDKTMTLEMEAQLCAISPSTIDRLLRPWRHLGGRRPLSTTSVLSG